MLPKALRSPPERQSTELKLVTEHQGSTQFNRPKCLVVDDLSANLYAMEAMLCEEDMDIHCANGASEALELMLKQEYALALIDVQMPDMDGFKLAELMRSSERTKNTPIIFVTAACTDINKIFKAYEAGAVDFIQKPVYDRIVKGKVRIFLELYNQKKKLEENSRALKLANKELEAFSYSVSHDLRAPLRSIEGFSRLLMKKAGDKLNDEERDYLDRINQSSLKMDELITCIISHCKFGHLEIKRSSVNLSRMCEEIVAERTNGMSERKFEIIISPDLSAHADPILCATILGNLIGNALKYTSKNSVSRIELGYIPHKNTTAFFVRDNGTGFNKADYFKLFEPFKRLHSEDEFKGSGIGLATVKRIVDRHRGEIWAETEIGGGSTFYFTLNSI
jgi:two-component system sensor histidine kinase/response regulator